ncbi:hypothetical protein GCM10027053_44760 [Intrasporangium mesophilum]
MADIRGTRTASRGAHQSRRRFLRGSASPSGSADYGVQWGTVGEWVGGLGTVAVLIATIKLASQARKEADELRREVQRDARRAQASRVYSQL